MCSEDLPSPAPWMVMDMEFARWKTRYKELPANNRPDSVVIQTAIQTSMYLSSLPVPCLFHPVSVNEVQVPCDIVAY